MLGQVGKTVAPPPSTPHPHPPKKKNIYIYIYMYNIPSQTPPSRVRANTAQVFKSLSERQPLPEGHTLQETALTDAKPRSKRKGPQQQLHAYAFLALVMFSGHVCMQLARAALKPCRGDVAKCILHFRTPPPPSKGGEFMNLWQSNPKP